MLIRKESRLENLILAESITEYCCAVQGWMTREYVRSVLKELVLKLDNDPMLTEVAHGHLVARRREPEVYEILISLDSYEHHEVRGHGDLPGHDRFSDTSTAAAEKVKRGNLSERQQMVLVAMRQRGARGFTDEELATLWPMWAESTARKRRVELERGLLVRKTDETRSTRAGRDAHVYVAAEHYEAWADRIRSR